MLFIYSRGDYWFWVPPVACVCGTLVFVTTYQLMIGNHLPMDDDDNTQTKLREHSDVNIKDSNQFVSKDSINTNETYVTENTKI